MSESVIVAHPLTGELVERLDQEPPEALAELFEALEQRQTRTKEMLAAVDGELQRRLQIRGRATCQFGDFEVEAKTPRESVWDADEAEGVLRELIDQGVLHAGELTGVITHETVLHRKEMNEVLGRLAGTPKDMLERCRTWRNKGKPKVSVTRSVALIPEETPDA